MTNAVRWEIELPQGPGRAMGAPRPKATLVYGEARRRLAIPLALGRSLAGAEGETLRATDEEALLEEVSEREASIAWEWLLKTLNRRDLTAREARDRLRREGYGDRAIAAAVDRAVELGFISDLRYAETFARQRMAAGWGRQRIVRELERRGVDVSRIDGWAEAHFDPEEEALRAREALSRRGVPERDPYGKLVRFLVGRGFDYAVAKAAAAERIDGDEDAR